MQSAVDAGGRKGRAANDDGRMSVGRKEYTLCREADWGDKAVSCPGQAQGVRWARAGSALHCIRLGSCQLP